MPEIRNYNRIDWTRQVINSSGEIPIKKGAFAILAVNIGAVGASQALIDGFPINPTLVAGANGESWSVGGVEGTIITKESLEIIFVTGVGSVFLQQAYYVGY